MTPPQEDRVTPIKFLPFLALLIVLLVPHSAAALPAATDIQNLLAAPDAAIENRPLLKDDLNAFYEARKFAPAWSFVGSNNGAAFAAFLASVLQLIDYHGLRREDYAIDEMQKLAKESDGDSMLKLEILTTDTLLRLAHDLHGDNNELEDLYPGWNFHRGGADIPALLVSAVAANGLNEFIDSMSPKNPAYGHLAQALGVYRGIAARGGWDKVKDGPILRLEAHDPHVAQIRTRLVAENYLPKLASRKLDNVYDEKLRQAVIAYQQRNGLQDDGNAGPKTIEAMNVPVAARIDQIRANMERWRHMPDDFPPGRYALVNIADASLDIFEDKRLIYHGPVIVGRVDRKTPFIQSAIRSMIINPAWHVPLKIAKKDILPKLRKDPHYLEKLGFVIRGSPNDPYGENIDWESMPAQEFNFRLRQSPGDMNSLGRLKFDFDNDFAVYMHGTPHQELFDKNERTFSSGCVRLHDPEEIAEILLSGNDGSWSVQKIDDEINGGATKWIGIKKPMPLFILYWTAFADDAGALNFRKDAYGYDNLLMAPLIIAPLTP
jgi:murein L,D-transpeptidase YcbB/YkuD